MYIIYVPSTEEYHYESFATHGDAQAEANKHYVSKGIACEIYVRVERMYPK